VDSVMVVLKARFETRGWGKRLEWTTTCWMSRNV
jgi:hypothetical protein